MAGASCSRVHFNAWAWQNCLSGDRPWSMKTDHGRFSKTKKTGKGRFFLKLVIYQLLSGIGDFAFQFAQ